MNNIQPSILLEKALSFSIQGDIYFKEASYNKAIVQYKESLKYLVGKDDAIMQNRADVFTSIAESHKRMQEREKTVVYYKKALAAFTAVNNVESMARTLSMLSQAERYLRNYELSLDYATRSLELHKTIDDPEGHAKNLISLAVIYRTVGRFEKSLEFNHEAYLYYKKINDPAGIAQTSNQIGLIYTRLEQFDLARSFYQVTIDQDEQQIPPRVLATALREISVIDIKYGLYDSAMEMINKANKIYQVEGNLSKQSITLRIIANIFRARHDYDNAADYYRKSLQKSVEINSIEYQLKAQTPLANLLIGTNTPKAIELLLNSVQLANKINDMGQLSYAYKALSKAEEEQGNYKVSLAYAKKEIELLKVVQKQKNNKKMILTKANLHSHKLEMDIAKLKEKLTLEQLESEKKNNQIEIAQQAKTINDLKLAKNRYASISLSALLIVCLVVLFFMYRRFTASKQKNKELDYLASRDPLTNCYNRRTLFNEMKTYFSNADLHNEYCIIMVDIDHFKRINDTYGHGMGDKVIQGVANVLQQSVRQDDIVARFGGEEFCIVLHHVEVDKAMKIADSIRNNIENSCFENISVTVSLGVSSIKFKAKIPSELIEQADLALYKSKMLGRNKTTLWEPSSKVETDK